VARRVRLVAVALALLMLTGCLTASVAISIEPNPIKFKFNKTEADITVKFTTKGFLNLKLDEMLVQLFENEDDEEPFMGRHVCDRLQLWPLLYLVLSTPKKLRYNYLPNSLSSMRLFTMRT